MKENKTKTHEEFVKSADDVALIAYKLIEKMDTNKGEMGIVIKDKDFREGQIITNENGEPVIDVNTGEVKKYPDAYYIEFSNSTFGTYKLKVDKDVFERLEVGERYILTYMLETKEVITKSKNGFEYVSKVLMIKPLHFENLKNIRVASWAAPWLSSGLTVTLGFLKVRIFGFLKV